MSDLAWESEKSLLRAVLEQVGVIVPGGTRARLIQQALELVAEDHGVTVAVLKGKDKGKFSARARRDAYAALRYLGLSLPHIGRLLNRDHSTVLAGLAKREAEVTKGGTT